MKLVKKAIAPLLIAVLTVTLCGCAGRNAESDGTTTELKALCGTQDDMLEYNPDRGWRLEAFINVANSDTDGMSAQPNPESVVTTALDRYMKYKPQLCQVYFYLTGYKNMPVIPQEGFDRMQRVFDAAKERGIKLIIRFAYESDMEGTGEAADEIMLAHMEQLKPLLEENADLIHTVEAGFLGAWGEWHSYKMSHDELALLKGILAMVPESLYVQVRSANAKNVLKNAEPESPELDRIGYHDDSFFGWQDAKYNDGLNPWDDQWEQMRKESAYVPEGGEMFWGCQYRLDLWKPTTGALAIQKYSAFHQNSFSIYHSFIEEPYVAWAVPGEGYYSIKDWEEETITTQWLDSYAVAYDPLWFQNEQGETVERTAFEFVNDHLGYRLCALNVTLQGRQKCGQTLDVSVNLKNTGFSAAFNMHSGFAVLDTDGNVVSAVEAGEPSAWLSTDPETKEALTHQVSATLTLPAQAGKYHIAFYLKNSAGTAARLANDLLFVNGNTVLQTIEIS